jgi:hypothetical protein
MRVSVTKCKPSSVASSGIPSNSLQLMWRGHYITFFDKESDVRNGNCCMRSASKNISERFSYHYLYTCTLKVTSLLPLILVSL